MKVGVFSRTQARSQVYSVLKALHSCKVQASAYLMGREWETLDGEEIRYIFSSLTHVLVLIDSSTLASRWLTFVTGYGAGRDIPVAYMPLDDVASQPLPPFLNPLTALPGVEAIPEHFRVEKEIWNQADKIERARADLQAMGLGLSDEVFATCVSEGNEAAVNDFLQFGFSPDTRDDRGVPILSLAVRARHRDLIDLLLDKGADVNAVSHDRGNTPLMEAAVRGDLETVRRLVEGGADLDLQSINGQTALMLAVGEGFTAVARFLIEHDADTSPVDKMNMTAGKYAQLFKHNEISELIRRRETAASQA